MGSSITSVESVVAGTILENPQTGAQYRCGTRIDKDSPVFFAEQLTQKGTVPCVAKLFSTTTQKYRAVNSYERESLAYRLLGQEPHPNLLRMLDTFTQDTCAVIILPRLVGTDAHALLERHTPISPRHLAPLLIGTANGLEAANARNVYHGDVKPKNIFLATQNGTPLSGRDMRLNRVTPVVIDLELTHIPGEPGIDATGFFIGSGAYVAPEVMETRERARTPATQVYSLAMIAYSVLSGKYPFESIATSDIPEIALSSRLPPLHEVASHVSLKITEVIEGGLSYSPLHRTPTPTVFAKQFLAAVQENPFYRSRAPFRFHIEFDQVKHKARHILTSRKK